VACPVDIIFVLDESKTIGITDFSLLKSFLSQLVGKLDVASGNTRVGLVTYSSDVGTTINLNDHLSVAELQHAITSVSYRAGGVTQMPDALAYVRTKMLTLVAGDRTNVPNVVVVITDGQFSNFTATKVSIKINLLQGL